MTQNWQEIDGRWHPCHWWQHLAQSRITAIGSHLTQEDTMATAIALIVVFAGAAAILGLAVHALVTLVRNDGYYPRRRPSAPVIEPPRSHPADLFDPRSHAA
jgi:hypothetical protein